MQAFTPAPHHTTRSIRSPRHIFADHPPTTHTHDRAADPWPPSLPPFDENRHNAHPGTLPGQIAPVTALTRPPEKPGWIHDVH